MSDCRHHLILLTVRNRFAQFGDHSAKATFPLMDDVRATKSLHMLAQARKKSENQRYMPQAKVYQMQSKACYVAEKMSAP